MLTKLIVVIISHSMHISNNYVVQLKIIQCFPLNLNKTEKKRIKGKKRPQVIY